LSSICEDRQLNISAKRIQADLPEWRRRTNNNPLNDWLGRASQSKVGELRSFASSLKTDALAVQAAMKEDWSNGHVEGHVNRPKFIKRSMDGRAKFDLLRARVRVKG